MVKARIEPERLAGYICWHAITASKPEKCWRVGCIIRTDSHLCRFVSSSLLPFRVCKRIPELRKITTTCLLESGASDFLRAKVMVIS